MIRRDVLLAGGARVRSPQTFMVIGVLPPDVRFTYPRDTQIYLLKPWTTIRSNRSLDTGCSARLRPGATAAQAQAELTTVAKNVTRGYGIEPQYLQQMLDRTATMAEPVMAHVQSEVRPGLLLLAGVAGLVLLIGCVNLGLLTLARTIDRTGELAVRSALGAGPRRIVRLLIVEGTVVARPRWRRRRGPRRGTDADHPLAAAAGRAADRRDLRRLRSYCC